MNNPFFKNKGPFKIDKLLVLANIDIEKKFEKSKIFDVKDLINASKFFNCLSNSIFIFLDLDKLGSAFLIKYLFKISIGSLKVSR